MKTVKLKSTKQEVQVIGWQGTGSPPYDADRYAQVLIKLTKPGKCGTLATTQLVRKSNLIYEDSL